jgi:hypothetical protein
MSKSPRRKAIKRARYERKRALVVRGARIESYGMRIDEGGFLNMTAFIFGSSLVKSSFASLANSVAGV